MEFRLGIADFLNRPIEQRVREFRYRAAQAFIFGIPVLALQWVGPRLGGAESERWIGILQALLCGWIVYVGAIGMVVEGAIQLRRWEIGVTLDFVAGAIALLGYLWSLGAVLPVFITGHLAYRPTLFHAVVILLIGWTGLRWWQLSNSVPKT